MQTIEDVPFMMTPKELARILNTDPTTITRGIRQGRIPADKVAGRWRICRDVVFHNAMMSPQALWERAEREGSEGDDGGR